MSSKDNQFLHEKLQLQIFKGVSLSDALEHCRFTFSMLSRNLSDLDEIMPGDSLSDFVITMTPPPDTLADIEPFEYFLVDLDIWKYINITFRRFPYLQESFMAWFNSEPDMWVETGRRFQQELQGEVGMSAIGDYFERHPDPTSQDWEEYTAELYELKQSTAKRNIEKIQREYKINYEAWKLQHARHLTLVSMHSRWRAGFLSTLNEAEQHVLQEFKTLREVKRNFLLRHEGINGIESSRAQWERDWSQIKEHPIPHTKLINLTSRHGICYGYDEPAQESFKGRVTNMLREIIPQTKNYIQLNNILATTPVNKTALELLDIYRSSCLEDKTQHRNSKPAHKLQKAVQKQSLKKPWTKKTKIMVVVGEKPNDLCHIHGQRFKETGRPHTNKECYTQQRRKSKINKTVQFTDVPEEQDQEAIKSILPTEKNYLCVVKSKINKVDHPTMDFSIMFDSGATCHAQGDATGLYDIEPCSFPITVANGEEMVCHKRGKRQLKIGQSRFDLRNVYICSGVDGLLLSVKNLIKESDHGILFTAQKVFLVDGETGKKSVIGMNFGNAYYATTTPTEAHHSNLLNDVYGETTLRLEDFDASLQQEFNRLLWETELSQVETIRQGQSQAEVEIALSCLDKSPDSTYSVTPRVCSKRLRSGQLGITSASSSNPTDYSCAVSSNQQVNQTECTCTTLVGSDEVTAHKGKSSSVSPRCQSKLSTHSQFANALPRLSDVTSSVKYFQLHCQLGHQSLVRVRDALRSGSVVVKSKTIKRMLQNIPDSFYCLYCDSARLERLPVGHTHHRATQILERVHSDIWKLPVRTPEGFKYVAVVVDEFSRHGFILPCRTKHDWVSSLETLFAQLNNKDPSLKIKALRSDGGELATSKSMATLCASLGVIMEVSPAYDKEFNGLVEAFIKVVTRKAATVLAQSRLPPMFSYDALSYACYIMNRQVHTITKETPIRRWDNTIPELDIIMPFGCQVLIYARKRTGRRDPERRNFSLSLSGDQGLFLGHHGTTLFRVWNQNRKCYQVIYNMKPYLNSFPGLSSKKWEQTPAVNSTDESEESAEEEAIPVETEEEMLFHESQETEVVPVTNTPYNLRHKRSASRIYTSTSNECEIPVVMTISCLSDTSDINEPKSDVPVTVQSISESSLYSGDQIYGSAVPWIQITLPERHRFRTHISKLSSLLNSQQQSIQLRSFVNDGYMRTFATSISSKKIPYPNANGKPSETIHVNTLPAAPKNRAEAKKSIYWKYWEQAEQVELNKMKEMDTSEVVLRPSGRKVLFSRWVYTYKFNNATKTLLEFRARLVACGYSQVEGLDYDEVFAPVVKIQSVRILLAIAVLLGLKVRQADIQTAFLNGRLDREIYMKMPPGYEVMDNSTGQSKVWLLKCTIYGLKQSPREWYAVLSNTLKSIGFSPLVSDACVFSKKQDGLLPILLMVYVDDLLIMCTDEAILDELMGLIKQSFKTRDMGDVDKIIGMEHVRFENSIYVGQPSYTRKILEQSDNWTIHTSDSERPVGIKLSPMSEGWKHDDDSVLLSEEDKTVYVHQLMQLVYLASHSRPDISYATNSLSAYLQKPTNCAAVALKRIMRYLRGTWDFGLHYINSNKTPILFVNDPRDIEAPTMTQLGLEVVGYADANYGPLPDRKSRTGWCFMLGGAVTTWSSKKQPVISLSSTEAEYYALGDGVKEALWLRELLSEIGFVQDKPMTLFQDNQSTMAIALNPIHHSHVKHMSIRSHFIRDHIAKEEVKLVYCPTGDMIADIFTKALPVKQHLRLTNLMGLRSLGDIRGVSCLNFYSEDLRF